MNFSRLSWGKLFKYCWGKEGGGKFCSLLELPISPFGDRLGALFLRFLGCFASVFPSSHSSRSLASLVSQKVGKTRPTQRPLRSRYAEQGGKKKTWQKTRLRGKCHNAARRHARHRRGTTESSEDASGTRCVASKVKRTGDVRDRAPSSDPLRRSWMKC